jgi:hypothetical protein
MTAVPRTNLRWLTTRDRLLLSTLIVESGCWEYQGYLDRHGYGRTCGLLAHRLSYGLFVGPIPAGLTIDHLCRNPRCVNPEHLEAVTQGENVRRGSAAKPKRHTHCPQGHPLNDLNVYVNPRSRSRTPQCRICLSAAKKRYRERQRAIA